MIYKFKSKATGDLIMTGPVGDRMLTSMGREPAPQGIFQVADMPHLIQGLLKGIEAEETAVQKAIEEAQREGLPAPKVPDISMRQRAWPLIEMLKACLDADKDIVWGV
jgi:Domain of unknown function (DUF1840)